MINLKKICMVIALVLLTAVNVSAAGRGEYELSRALGLLPAEEYNSESAVTRAELAYIVASVSGVPSLLMPRAGSPQFSTARRKAASRV